MASGKRAARKSVMTPVDVSKVSKGKRTPKKPTIKRKLPKSQVLTDRSNSSSTATIFAKRKPSTMSIKKPSIIHGAYKKPTPGTKKKSNALQEILYYQKNCTSRLIQRGTAARYIRNILVDINKANTRVTMLAMDTLHEIFEIYAINIMELGYLVTRHSKRVTLYATDILLVSRILNQGFK